MFKVTQNVESRKNKQKSEKETTQLAVAVIIQNRIEIKYLENPFSKREYHSISKQMLLILKWRDSNDLMFQIA